MEDDTRGRGAGGAFHPIAATALVLLTTTAAVAAATGCGSSPSSTTARTATPATKTSPATSTQTPRVGVVIGTAGSVTATLKAGTHHPKVNASWPIHFTVTDAGRPARASVSYEYLFAGQVVARRSHYTFDGHFSDTFHWPASAVGYPLTFRAVIVSGGATVNLDYPVQVVA